MKDVRAFQAIAGATTPVANAVAATAKTVLPPDSDTAVLYNSSATATNFFRVTTYQDQGNGPADSSTTAPTVLLDMPIPPLAQIRVYTGTPGTGKLIRFIASAADGTTYVTPGQGV